MSNFISIQSKNKCLLQKPLNLTLKLLSSNHHHHQLNHQLNQKSFFSSSSSSHYSPLLSRLVSSPASVSKSYSHVTSGPTISSSSSSPISSSTPTTTTPTTSSPSTTTSTSNSLNTSTISNSTSTNHDIRSFQFSDPNPSSFLPPISSSDSNLNNLSNNNNEQHQHTLSPTESRDALLRDQELHRLHTSTLLPPSISGGHNFPDPITDPLLNRSLLNVDHNTKLLDDSYNYDAMPFEELLEAFEEDNQPFNEAHSSSSLGHTIVIHNKNSLLNNNNNEIGNSNTTFDLSDLNSVNGVAPRRIYDYSNVDTPFPITTPHSATPLPNAAAAANAAATTTPLFNHSCGLEFKFALSGYAYHTSKNPSRQTLMDSLPQSLLDQTQNYALDNGTPISLHRGDHDPGDAEHPNNINDIPVEAFDKIEMGGVTSMGCGEDSVVGSSQILALADGVSGWNLKTGGHAALWSRLILHRTLSNFSDLFNSTSPEKLKLLGKTPRSKSMNADLLHTDLHVSQALDKAFHETKSILEKQQESGSSTIILTALDTVDKSAHIISIGDSSIWIFRNKEVIYTVDHGVKTGCPKQLGTNTNALPTQLDTPTTFTVEPDDIVLMCSDGLSDNLFIGEITETLFEGLEKNGLQGAADDLVALALDRSFDSFAVCPYQLNASPFSTGGGKSDDISVLVATVVSS